MDSFDSPPPQCQSPSIFLINPLLVFIKASHPLRLVTTSPEGQSQLHKHHFWPWDTSSVYSFKCHLKDPLAQSVTLAAIRMLAVLVLEFLVLQDAVSLLSQKGALVSLHPSPDSSILLNVHQVVNLPSYSFGFPQWDSFTVSLEGFPLRKRKCLCGG